jgi:hypothetical protein
MSPFGDDMLRDGEGDRIEPFDKLRAGCQISKEAFWNAKLISPREFIRLVYRFVAETMPETIGDFAPVNVRGGGTGTKLPNTDPSDPQKDDLNNV